MIRVAITGVGAVTPIGNNVPTFWENLKKGTVGIGRITHFDPKDVQCQVAAEIHGFDPLVAMEKKEAKRHDRFTQLACVAAKEAVEGSGFKGHYDPTEIGTVIGSGIGGQYFNEEQSRVFIEKGTRRVSPFLIPRIICNSAGGQVAILHGFQGPCCCPVTACATGGNAIGDAYLFIRQGICKVVVAGGTEAAITPLSYAGFANMGALTSRNEDPLQASTPFDKRRDGFVMGEGAGVVVLEEWESAKKRGANILAELVGYGVTCDAYHMTAPSPEGDGASRAMNMAIKMAGVGLEKIGHINAHGTSTPMNDRLETLAIRNVFGEQAKKIAISSNKSMIGHTIGAAGAIEAIASIMSLRDGVVPPTMGYREPDPDCDLDYVPNEARNVALTHVISNSFGFGGHNVCVAVAKV